jgi:hypothetical protein
MSEPFSSQLFSLLNEAKQNLEKYERLDNLSKRIESSNLRKGNLFKSLKSSTAPIVSTINAKGSNAKGSTNNNPEY